MPALEHQPRIGQYRSIFVSVASDPWHQPTKAASLDDRILPPTISSFAFCLQHAAFDPSGLRRSHYLKTVTLCALKTEPCISSVPSQCDYQVGHLATSFIAVSLSNLDSNASMPIPTRPFSSARYGYAGRNVQLMNFVIQTWNLAFLLVLFHLQHLCQSPSRSEFNDSKPLLFYSQVFFDLCVSIDPSRQFTTSTTVWLLIQLPSISISSPHTSLPPLSYITHAVQAALSQTLANDDPG